MKLFIRFIIHKNVFLKIKDTFHKIHIYPKLCFIFGGVAVPQVVQITAPSLLVVVSRCTVLDPLRRPFWGPPDLGAPKYDPFFLTAGLYSMILFSLLRNNNIKIRFTGLFYKQIYSGVKKNYT